MKTYDFPHSESFFPPRFKLAGMLLSHMTMGHALLLTALESPLIPTWDEDQPTDVSEADVALFAYVCTRTWRQAAKGCKAGGWFYRRTMWKMHRRVRAIGLTDALVQAIKYRDFNLKERPETEKAAKHEREYHSPSLGVFTARFCSFGWTFDEIMDASVRALRWEVLIEGDISGTVIIKQAGSAGDELALAARREFARQGRAAIAEKLKGPKCPASNTSSSS